MIRIYGLDEHLKPRRQLMSDTIHASMVAVLALPENKRAHRFIRLDPGDFFVPEGRSERYTVIEQSMIAGRQVKTRKALIHDLFARFEADLQIAPIDLEITISEQPASDWGFRGMTGDEAVLNYPIKL